MDEQDSLDGLSARQDIHLDPVYRPHLDGRDAILSWRIHLRCMCIRSSSSQIRLCMISRSACRHADRALDCAARLGACINAIAELMRLERITIDGGGHRSKEAPAILTMDNDLESHSEHRSSGPQLFPLSEQPASLGFYPST